MAECFVVLYTDGGRGGIARRTYIRMYVHVRMSCMHACMCTREKEERKKRAKQCEGKAAGVQGVGGSLREARRERREWKKEGGQVTPPRAAVAAGEITAPSLLARDVHKLCITPSGAHANEPRK